MVVADEPIYRILASEIGLYLSLAGGSCSRTKRRTRAV
jgi:hypothetical protein